MLVRSHPPLHPPYPPPTQPTPSQSAGRDGIIHPFNKPWASTLIMFVGMAACLPAAAVARCVASRLRRLEARGQDGSAAEPLLLLSRLERQSPWPPLLGRRSPGTPASTVSTANSLSEAPATASWGYDGNAGTTRELGGAGGPRRYALALVLVPTCFDLAATILLSVGLLHVSASVFSMVGRCLSMRCLASDCPALRLPATAELVVTSAGAPAWLGTPKPLQVRGSEVIFSALLATALLRCRLNRWHLCGIALCAVSGGAQLQGRDGRH